MPKKSESGNSAVSVERKVKKEKKSTSCSPSAAAAAKEQNKTQTPRDEIDAIFAVAGKKRKKPDGDKEKKAYKKNPAVKDVGKRVSKNSAGDRSITKKTETSSRREYRGPRKKTGDGFAIYTEEELGVGKADAGGTRLCPFDCDCCF